MPPICAESTWEITNYGRFINKFPLNIRQFTGLTKKIFRQKMSIMFNQIYIYIYILPRPADKPLPRPADKPKHIKLHARVRTIISEYDRN